MKKGLHIATSSRSLHSELDSLRCQGLHEHQVIEGSTIAHGQVVQRSAFSELYPRRFARRVAKVLLKNTFPMEKPVSSLVDPALVLLDAVCTLNDRPAKRQCLSNTRTKSKQPADRSPAKEPSVKKLRSEPDNNPSESLKDKFMIDSRLDEIMAMIEPLLPRVGRKQLDQPKVVQAIQQVFAEKTIKCIVACKGTDRTLGPPERLNGREAPFRRAIMKSRIDGKIFAESTWEKYDQLSNRKLIRKSHPCRVNITVFAANPDPAPEPVSPPIEQPKALPAPSRIDGSDSSRAVPVEPQEVTPSVQSSDMLDMKPEIEKNPETPEEPQTAPIPPESHAPAAHGPRLLALPKEEQTMLKRAHQNLCHPSPQQFSAVLRQQGARVELQQAVFDMTCPVCSSLQKPKIARPSTVKHELDFNDKIFIDGISWTSQSNRTFHFYHIIDQATNYHVAVPAPSRTAENAIRCLTEAWLVWAGAPNMIVTDSATEFTSEAFAEFLQRHDIKPTTTAPYAHWQNGRCERHGDVLQNMLNRVDAEHPLETYDDLWQALVQCTNAKNTLSIRRGYSPEILVFGKRSKLPGSLVSSEGETSLASANREDALGALGIHVDDGIHGGDAYFQQQISKLERKYPFGSKKSKMFTFTGIDLQQFPDNSIELSQSKYVRNINAISISPERRADENSPVTEQEKHQLRGLIGSLQYAAVHTRPDLSSSLSLLQSEINRATVSTLIPANKALHIAKKHHDVTIKIKPIKPEDLRFLAFSDASFASKSKPESHAGMIILATHKDIAQNKACPISPISWGTKKIQRVVTSTLSAETSALSTTLDQLTWLRLYWAWIFDQTIKWQNPSEIRNLPQAITVPTLKTEEKDLAITDCKSLYDLTTRTAVPNCQEYRTQLQARSIKDILAEGIQLHWVHSGAQLADALTKWMEATFLRSTLRQGTYCLHDAHEVLKERASVRNRLRWLKSTSSEMS
eukprot:s1817_g14.t1